MYEEEKEVLLYDGLEVSVTSVERNKTVNHQITETNEHGEQVQSTKQVQVTVLNLEYWSMIDCLITYSLFIYEN